MPKVNLLPPLRRNDNRESARRKLQHATNVALRWMAPRWPEAFPDDPDRICPLTIGIRDQVLEAIGTEPNAPDAGIVLRALGMWTKSGPYVTAAAKGRNRLNLDGTVATPISDAHRAYAQRVLDERKARRKPATAPKLRPALIASSRASTRPTLARRRST